ncbi:MAG TPA: phosphatidylinositol mannoside acyltransferase [Acidimicrobiales bacterium]|nr:phosphatidylinositol mannoside acyltransferase [Acidimicrobiales bacterium]
MLRAGAAAASVLPGGVGRALAETAGLGAARLPARAVAGRRALVRRHLRRVVGPGVATARLEGMVDEAFASYARYWAESLRLPSLADHELEAAMSVRGFGHLHDAAAAGRGVILALPHLGGWEWGGTWLARTGWQVSVVVEVLGSPDVFEWFAGFRSGLGMEVIPNGPAAASACLRALRAGRVLCLLSDRVVGATPGVTVDLFGAPARLPAGAATLALRSGAPVLPAAVYFTGGGGHLAVVRPPVGVRRGPGRLRDDVEAGTAGLARELEALIAAAPTQWHLFQPLWDDDPPL